MRSPCPLQHGMAGTSAVVGLDCCVIRQMQRGGRSLSRDRLTSFLTAFLPLFTFPGSLGDSKQVYAHAGTTLQGKMYITCGRRGEDYLKETHCYDPGSNTWHTLADGPVRRAWHGMAALLDKLFVIGGSNNDAGYRRDVHQVSRAQATHLRMSRSPGSSPVPSDSMHA